MAKSAVYTYYCEIYKDRYNFNKGVYTYTSDPRKHFKFLTLMQYSDKIWRQGPKGGVKIIKDRTEQAPSTYITKNKEFMKEFMWVKLQAKPYHA